MSKKQNNSSITNFDKVFAIIIALLLVLIIYSPADIGGLLLIFGFVLLGLIIKRIVSMLQPFIGNSLVLSEEWKPSDFTYLIFVIFTVLLFFAYFIGSNRVLFLALPIGSLLLLKEFVGIKSENLWGYSISFIAFVLIFQAAFAPLFSPVVSVEIVDLPTDSTLDEWRFTISMPVFNLYVDGENRFNVGSEFEIVSDPNTGLIGVKVDGNTLIVDIDANGWDIREIKDSIIIRKS